MDHPFCKEHPIQVGNREKIPHNLILSKNASGSSIEPVHPAHTKKPVRAYFICAGWGNRTPDQSLENSYFTTKLIPQSFCMNLSHKDK